NGKWELDPILLQPDCVVGIVLGSIGEDDLVSHVQTVDDLHRIYRSSAKMHLHPSSALAVVSYFEETDNRFFPSVNRSTHIKDVVEPADLDDFLNRDCACGSIGQLALQNNIHSSGSFCDARVDMRDLTGNDAHSCVDRGGLT